MSGVVVDGSLPHVWVAVDEGPWSMVWRTSDGRTGRDGIMGTGMVLPGIVQLLHGLGLMDERGLRCTVEVHRAGHGGVWLMGRGVMGAASRAATD